MTQEQELQNALEHIDTAVSHIDAAIESLRRYVIATGDEPLRRTILANLQVMRGNNHVWPDTTPRGTLQDVIDRLSAVIGD